MFSICILKHFQKLAQLELLVTPVVLGHLLVKISIPDHFWKWDEVLKPFKCLHSLSSNQATSPDQPAPAAIILCKPFPCYRVFAVSALALKRMGCVSVRNHVKMLS